MKASALISRALILLVSFSGGLTLFALVLRFLDQASYFEPVWFGNAWIFSLTALVLERTVGFQRGFLAELRKCWRKAAAWARMILALLLLLALVANLWAIFRSLSGSFGWLPEQARMMQLPLNPILPGLSEWAPLPINLIVLLAVCLLLLRGKQSMPEWSLQRLGDRATTYRHSMLNTVNSEKLVLMRKAEKLLERGKLLKAAHLFEQLGGEHLFQAGTLFREKNLLKEAKSCFLKSGQYHQKQRSWQKAGDGFFLAESWAAAADAYQNLLNKDSVRLDRERNKLWLERCGEALFLTGRYRDAGEFYTSMEWHQLAGEAFAKANLPQRAAEAFRLAGDHDSSYQVLKAAGENALAVMARGKGMMLQGDYGNAAALFESAGQQAAAAEAYNKSGQPRKAARAFFAAHAWEKAAEAYIEAGEEEQALACYERLGDYNRAAELASHLGLQDRQAEYSEKAGFYAAAARAYIMIGEMAKAVESFHKIREEKTGELQEALQILKILEERDRERDALTCALGLLEGRTLTPALAPVLLLITQIYQRMGKLDKALARINEAAKLVPENREYRAYAEALRGRLGLPSEAAPAPAPKPASMRTTGLFQQSPVLQAQLAKTAATPVTSGHDFPAGAALPSPRSAVKHGDEHTPALEGSSALSPPSGIAIHSAQIGTAGISSNRQPELEEAEEVDNTATLEFDAYHPAQEGALARYQIIRELGRGGMGVVFKARDRKLKRLVAIKMLNPDYSQDPKILLFFKREAQAIAALNHPNIVGIYDIGQERGSYYMVMEFIEGYTLDRLLRRNPEVLRKSLLWLWLQSCEGLKYAHEQGIIHRDIKPSNLMVTQNRGFKILDFGLAKHVADPNQTQQVWGTPSYMAPELFYGERASAQTDIYALGACFYVLACGDVPCYQDPSDKFVGNGLPKPAHELNPLLPKPVSEAIQNCLQLDPLKRFADVHTLMKHLKLLRN